MLAARIAFSWVERLGVRHLIIAGGEELETSAQLALLVLAGRRVEELSQEERDSPRS